MDDERQINAWECLNRAQDAFKDKKYDRAKRLAEKAIRIYPVYETIAQILLQDIREAQSNEKTPDNADRLPKSFSSPHVDSTTRKELNYYIKMAEDAIKQQHFIAAEKWTQKAKELKENEPKPSTSGLHRSQSDTSNKHDAKGNNSDIETYIKNAEEALSNKNLEDAEMWTKKAQEFRDKHKKGHVNNNEEKQNDNLTKSMRDLNISGCYSLPEVTGSLDDAQDIINKAYASFETGDLGKAENFLNKAERCCPTSEVKILVEQARAHMKSRDERRNVDPDLHEKAAEPPTGADDNDDDDDICPICQDPCGENRSFTDPCMHRFCFQCICTWCEQKTSCPLCNGSIKLIRYNIRPDHGYDEYKLDERGNVGSDGEQDRRHTGEPNTGRLNLGVRDLFGTLNLELLRPIQPLAYPDFSALYGRDRQSDSEDEDDLPDPGDDFRLSVYERNIWAHPLPDAAGRFRTCTPEFYRGRADRTSRLTPWILRELNCLIHQTQVYTVHNEIMNLLRRYSVQSAAFEHALRPYLSENTKHFLHELYVYARCPYNVENYDELVQYSRR